MIFETARLRARDWQDRDLPTHFEMYSDPQVVQFIGMEPLQTLDDSKKHLERIARLVQRYRPGLGGWCLEHKDSGEVVGLVLLKNLPDADGGLTADIEVGWHLARRHWGHGYATEAGQGALAYGFETMGLDRIHAVVNTRNEASMAVAHRLGMVHQGTTDRYYGQTLEWFVRSP